MDRVVQSDKNAPLTRRVGRIGAATLRRVFAKFAENSALSTLQQTCVVADVVISETTLRTILRETIVPAYNNGWLEDVVTLKQLQRWVDRRANLALADPLVDIIGLHQYFLLHCLSSAVDADKIAPKEVIIRCPAAAYLYQTLFDDALLDSWRSGAANVRRSIQSLDPRDGLEYWLFWVKNLETHTTYFPTIELPPLDNE